MKKVFINELTGDTKTVKEGFSWTNLFFGIFTPLCRGDIKWTIIQFITNICTVGISLLVFPFIYNKMYIKDLAKKGYKEQVEATVCTTADATTNISDNRTTNDKLKDYSVYKNNKNIQQWSSIGEKAPILKGLCNFMIKLNVKQLKFNESRITK